MGNAGTFKKIQNQDKTITPFKAYKSWAYSTTSSLDSDNLDRLVAIKPDPSKYSGNRVTLDTWQTSIDSASFLINTANNKQSSVIWYSLNHLYYKRSKVPYDSFGYSNPWIAEKTLFNEASVISIPQKKFGESIKPGSVILKLRNSQLNSETMTLTDDGNGNLIDRALSSSISNELLHIGFDDTTYSANWAQAATSSGVFNSVNTKIVPVPVETTIQNLKVVNRNVTYSPQLNIPYKTYECGNAAFFSGSYIRISNTEELNFKRSEDFAIAFWLHRMQANAQKASIVSKNTIGLVNVLQKKLVKTKDVNLRPSQFPFDIYFEGNTGSLYCRSSNGSVQTSISTNNINVGDIKHVLLQKTGSSFQLYVNGQLASSASLPLNGNTQNQSDIFIGSKVNTNLTSVYESFTGAIDDFFIFNRGLTANEITQLSYTGSINLMTTNTNVVGNVFYEHGIIVVSDPRPKYGTSAYKMFNDKLYDYNTSVTQSGYLSDFYLEYNSTVTLYEHEYICKIKEDEFNFTSNPTIRLNEDPNSEIPKSYVASSSFSPYITTIGLYSKNGELLAIGKLGTPIKKRDNVDLNLIVRFDI